MKNAMEYSQLKTFVGNFKQNFKQDNIDKFFVDTSQKLVNELYNQLWVRTPVRTGFLRRGFDAWTRQELEYWSSNNYGYKSYNKKKFSIKSKAKQMQYKTNFSSIKPSKDNNKYSVHIRNPVYYAGWVEFGHKQKVGRYVPAIGKTLKQKEVKGRFYMKTSIEKLQDKAPQIIKQELTEFIKGVK